jgi:hypothetical protein
VTGPRLKSRKYGKTGHGYLLDGERIDGVTKVLNALPKALTQWSSDCAANYAVEHWDELGEESLTKRLDKIRFAHRDTVGQAALRGTTIHKYGEDLVAGKPVEDPEYLGPAQAYARFLDKWGIEPIAVETPVCNTTYRYAGRPDLWATIGARDNATALVDLKTGKAVYEAVVLQVAAYRYADLWQPNGPDSETATPEVDLTYVVHIQPDDVTIHRLEAGPKQLRAFLYVQQTARWLRLHGFKGEEPLIGEAEHP